MGSIFCWSGRGRIFLNTHSGLEQDGISSLGVGGSQNSVWCQALISSTEPSSSSMECIPLEALNIWCNDKLFLVWDPFLKPVKMGPGPLDLAVMAWVISNLISR